MKQCKQCNAEFEAKRNDAKFCSAKCRVTFNRVTDNVTDKRDVTECDGASVTAVGTAPGGVIGGQCFTAKPTFDDLPQDVQYEILLMCSENNSGERAGSHTRQAMTERALSYQAMHPSPYSRGASTARPVMA